MEASEARAGGPLPQPGPGQTTQAPKPFPRQRTDSSSGKAFVTKETDTSQEPAQDSPKDMEVQMPRWSMPQQPPAGKPLNTGLKPNTTQLCESLRASIVLESGSDNEKMMVLTPCTADLPIHT